METRLTGALRKGIATGEMPVGAGRGAASSVFACASGGSKDAAEAVGYSRRAGDSGRIPGSALRDDEQRRIRGLPLPAVASELEGDFATEAADSAGRMEQALRDSQDELRRLSALLISIQEDERRRIALDLHDGLGQSLSLVKLLVENSAVLVAAGENVGAGELLRRVVPALKEALLEVRRVATELRPSILDDLGLLPTLSWFFREFEQACGHIVFEKVLDIDENDVPESLKITLYRILQEATSNILKHAGADRVRVCLARDGDVLRLQIEDNGRGFDPERVSVREGHQRGLGLLSMKERASLSGADYVLESAPGAGTSIRAAWRCGDGGGPNA